LNKNRLINGQVFDEDYREYLIFEIQETKSQRKTFLSKKTLIILKTEIKKLIFIIFLIMRVMIQFMYSNLPKQWII